MIEGLKGLELHEGEFHFWVNYPFKCPANRDIGDSWTVTTVAFAVKCENEFVALYLDLHPLRQRFN